MVVSIQPVQNNIVNLNKIGFGTEEKETAQTPVSLENPKDIFVKKESHAVRNGALVGGSLALIKEGLLVFNDGGFSEYFKNEKKTLEEFMNLEKGISKTKAGMWLASALVIATGLWAGVGAGVGAVYKACTKND